MVQIKKWIIGFCLKKGRFCNKNRGFVVEIKKKCSKCGLWKNPDDFHRHKSTKDGLRSMCKDCKRRYAKEYRKTHPKQRHEEKRRYRQAHSEKRREASRKDHKTHSEKRREAGRKYRKAHPEKVREDNLKSGRKKVSELLPSYVRGIIHTKHKIPRELISVDMVERERDLQQINRILRKEKQNV